GAGEGGEVHEERDREVKGDAEREAPVLQRQISQDIGGDDGAERLDRRFPKVNEHVRHHRDGERVPAEPPKEAEHEESAPERLPREKHEEVPQLIDEQVPPALVRPAPEWVLVLKTL